MYSERKTPAIDAFVDSGCMDFQKIIEEGVRAESEVLLQQKKDFGEIAKKMRIPESYLEIAFGLPKKKRPLYIDGIQVLDFQNERDAAREKAREEAIQRSREQIANAQTVEEARALAINAPDLDTRDLAIRKIYELF